MARFTCISADSHVIEPGDLWLKYIDPQYRDRAPRLVHEKDHDSYVCEGKTLLPIASVSNAGVPNEKRTLQGRFETNVPRGAWDPDARLKEMEVDGVQAELLYPTMALRLFSLEDTGFRTACLQAYNNWIADYCGAHPDRLKAVGLIPIEDIELAIGELQRCQDLGLAGGSIAIYQDPDRHYGDPVFEPFWAAAQDLEMPVSLHILSERQRQEPAKNRPPDFTGNLVMSQWIQRSLGNLAWSGVLNRFPELKLVSAENDIGWVPYFLERLDYVFDTRQNIVKWGLSRDIRPSDVIKRNVYHTFMRDRSGIATRHLIGVSHIMWSSDYPHGDSTWPESQEMIDSIMGDVPAEERHAMLAGNAAEMYGF